MNDLRPLRAWLAAHPDPDEPIATNGGGEVTLLADGTRVTQLPYPIYAPAMTAFWAALAGTGFAEAETRAYRDVIARWLAAHGAARLQPVHLAAMDRETLFNALRWYDRGERFSEGLWAAAWKEGVFHAAARAVLALPPG